MAFKQIFPKILLFLAIGALVAFSSFSAKKQDLENRLALQEFLKIEEKNYLMGRFEPAEREDFIAVPAKYNAGGYKMYLRKEAMSAFLEMAEMAKNGEIDLKIASATRNFDYQKNI